MFFATSILHVHLMQWDDDNLVEQAVNKCNEIWESIEPNKVSTDITYCFLFLECTMYTLVYIWTVSWLFFFFILWIYSDFLLIPSLLSCTHQRQQCLGLLFYNELLHIFYRLRLCDYKNAAPHVDKLDAAMKSDMQRTQHMKELTNELNALNQSLSRSGLHYRDRAALSEKQALIQEQLRNMSGLSSIGRESLEPVYFGNVRRTLGDKLLLAPPPIDGEWLPKSAVYAIVDLITVIFGRPKGLFKECGKRIQSGISIIQGSFYWIKPLLAFFHFTLFSIY